MPTSNPATQITTKDTVKLMLGLTTTESDALLTKMCDWITQYIHTYCGRKFLETTITEKYNSSDFKFSFWLNNSPVASITSFKKKQSDGTWKDLVLDEDYEVNLQSGFIRLYEIDNGIADLEIVYKTQENIPADVEMVATQLVISAFNRRSNMGVVNESLGEASIQWGALTTDDQKKTLDRYSRASSFIA